MEQVLGEIACPYSDPEINKKTAQPDESAGSYTRHFNQSEEFFLRLAEPITVPSFPVHHDVRIETPDQRYLDALRKVVAQLFDQAPDVFSALTHLFDPAESLRPGFFKLYRYSEMIYLYLLRLDLNYRPNQHEVVEKGSNDVTPRYRTSDIILEPDLIPIVHFSKSNGKLSSVQVEQSVSQTWIGETGRGYFVQGIWLDRDLTKFFSKLFTPEGVRVYPYFPFSCKYRAICHSLLELGPQRRQTAVPLLHEAREYLRPHMEEIQKALRQNQFSTELEAFKRLRKDVPGRFEHAWDHVKLQVYLNDQDMKEFSLD